MPSLIVRCVVNEDLPDDDFHNCKLVSQSSPAASQHHSPHHWSANIIVFIFLVYTSHLGNLWFPQLFTTWLEHDGWILYLSNMSIQFKFQMDIGLYAMCKYNLKYNHELQVSMLEYFYVHTFFFHHACRLLCSEYFYAWQQAPLNISILLFFRASTFLYSSLQVSMLGNISMLVSLCFYARVLMSLCLKIFYMIVSLCFYALVNL